MREIFFECLSILGCFFVCVSVCFFVVLFVVFFFLKDHIFHFGELIGEVYAQK